MEQQQNNKNQMPRFNMSWIYGLVLVGLLVLYFTHGRESSSISTTVKYSDFKAMVEKGYAQEIVVNKYQNTVEMYVKPENIRDVFHQGVQQTGEKPSVMVEIGSVDKIEEFIEQEREAGKFAGKLSYDNSKYCSFVVSSCYGCLSCVVWVAVVPTSAEQACLA